MSEPKTPGVLVEASSAGVHPVGAAAADEEAQARRHPVGPTQAELGEANEILGLLAASL